MSCCQHCGTKTPNSARFCPECGKSTVTAESAGSPRLALVVAIVILAGATFWLLRSDSPRPASPTVEIATQPTPTRAEPMGSPSPRQPTEATPIANHTPGTFVDPPNPAVQENDWTIVPNNRVGPITSASSLESLRAAFGEANLVLADVVIEAGEVYAGCVIYPQDPERKISVVWSHPKRQRGVRCVLIKGTASQWVGPRGLSLGKSLEEVQRLNGKPFKVYSFHQHWGGTITDWQKGELGDELDLMAVILKHSCARQCRETWGQKELSSDHPVMEIIKPEIHAFQLNFGNGRMPPNILR